MLCCTRFDVCTAGVKIGLGGNFLEEACCRSGIFYCGFGPSRRFEWWLTVRWLLSDFFFAGGFDLIPVSIHEEGNGESVEE